MVGHVSVSYRHINDGGKLHIVYEIALFVNGIYYNVQPYHAAVVAMPNDTRQPVV